MRESPGFSGGIASNLAPVPIGAQPAIAVATTTGTGRQNFKFALRARDIHAPTMGLQSTPIHAPNCYARFIPSHDTDAERRMQPPSVYGTDAPLMEPAHLSWNRRIFRRRLK